MAADPDHRTRITESEQAGLVALMVADLDAVRSWVSHALGPLAIDVEGNARLRDTGRAPLRLLTAMPPTVGLRAQPERLGDVGSVPQTLAFAYVERNA